MLLEVIVALVLFVLTASVIVGGLSTSASSMERLENELRASNLAYSVLARLKMGALEQPAKPNETPEGWSWELVTSPFARPRSGGSHTFVDRVDFSILRLIVEHPNYR